MSVLILPATLARQIEHDGQSIYPNECCGILIGTDELVDRETHRRVEELQPVANEFDSAEQHHRFLISADIVRRAEERLSGSGRMILGFYHSHPDHPARPSEFDRQQAWPFYSYLIVSIVRGQTVDMTSWLLDESSRTFKRQDIVET